MGYQALLFCPDEKLARVVSQVFSELDFTVEQVHEPFAAVKKLMSQRYDAIVVDCENEQNASLLFKSARNSSSNQSSLAIALVEGQAGVAKAYRIGANLVLTKPINVEQAKGTLRVARGLLRKNADAAAASAPAPAMPSKTGPVSAPSSVSASRGAATTPPPSRQEVPEIVAPLPAMIQETRTPIPDLTASAKTEDNVEGRTAAVPAASAPPETIKKTIADEPAAEGWQPPSLWAVSNDSTKNVVVKNEAAITAAPQSVQNPSPAFASSLGSAAAPAPAKEVMATSAPETAKENKTVEFEPTRPSHVHSSHTNSPQDGVPISMFSSVSTIDSPSFAGLGEEDSGGSGKKKILIAAVVVVAIAALGYVGYGKLNQARTQSANTAQDSRQSTPALAPMSSPVAAPSMSAADRPSSLTQSPGAKTATAAPLDKPSASVSNSPVIRIAANPEPGTKQPDSAPIHVKSATRAKTQGQSEESAVPLPSPLAIASANDPNLNGLMASASTSVPKPSLATVRISQGVSQGLVIKRVQPKYPPAALAVRAQGAVQIEATINKEGSVTNLKVLSGDPVLARAALDAVRQWRYKPYYLDGQPVEIETQITVNFKAN